MEGALEEGKCGGQDKSGLELDRKREGYSYKVTKYGPESFGFKDIEERENGK
jgi:hypothetical protein